MDFSLNLFLPLCTVTQDRTRVDLPTEAPCRVTVLCYQNVLHARRISLDPRLQRLQMASPATAHHSSSDRSSSKTLHRSRGPKLRPSRIYGWTVDITARGQRSMVPPATDSGHPLLIHRKGSMCVSILASQPLSALLASLPHYSASAAHMHIPPLAGPIDRGPTAYTVAHRLVYRSRQAEVPDMRPRLSRSFVAVASSLTDSEYTTKWLP